MKKSIAKRKRPALEQVILISTPWPLFNRPSIQLGCLKAYLKAEFPDLKVQAHHFYLEAAAGLGYRLYQAVSEKTWPAECVYAALLHPDRREQIEKLFRRDTALRKTDFQDLVEQTRKITDDYLERADWPDRGLVGFTLGSAQLTSALYLIRRIKEKRPGLIIVVGGSMFAGESWRGLLQAFPQIDLAVSGEGERPLSRLVSYLRDSADLATLPPVPGVVARNHPPLGEAVTSWQAPDLSALPSPDFDDYFKLLDGFGPGKNFFPALTVEASRGCWRRRSIEPGETGGCAFCNLNRQWRGYRAKSPGQIAAEIDGLTGRHKVLAVNFMDNLLPVKSLPETAERLDRLGKDLALFGEIRATTPFSVLAAMKAAGFREVQIGIEALSTSLLKKINKGTTAMDNLEIMKNCEELGLVNASNLIVRFPGSDEAEVEETLRNIELAQPFRPLKITRFWLGLESPVWRNPEKFGLKAVYNHKNYEVLFPQEIVRPIHLPIQGFRGEVVRQRKLWREVEEKVRAWTRVYEELHRKPASEPILSYRDGRDFLIIRQRRPGAEPLTHRLVGASREIYLFCGRRRSIKEICAEFPRLSEDKIRPFLRLMLEKKLMFEEKEEYLSLAVASKRRD